VQELTDLVNAIEIPEDFRSQTHNTVRSNVNVREVLNKVRELKLQI